MAAGDTKASGEAGGKPADLVIERVFDAPPRLVFEAWSKPENLKQWFGPKGCGMWKFEVEFRERGKLEFGYTGPDGTKYPPFIGTYGKIEAPKRIEFAGKLLGPEEQKVQTAVTFEEVSGKTKVTVHQTYERESYATRGAPEGWRQTLERLNEFLARA
ncbi:MAG TPA: SRPBCC domain-containing protein [Candidatus Acidoferrales bacterium]|nr:SRPBCC domain-containing protein [Candidatus Acidoferrales bacterium]